MCTERFWVLPKSVHFVSVHFLLDVLQIWIAYSISLIGSFLFMMDNSESWKGKIEEIYDSEDVGVNKEDDTPSSERGINHLPLTTSEFVQQTSQFSFQFLRQGLETIDKSVDFREQLLQYNLTTSTLNNLQFFSYRFHGLFNPQLMSDYEILLKEFFQQSDIRQTLGIIGDPDAPMKIQHSPIGLNTLAMDFFDRLYQSAVITPDGRIRGCFDETFDGLTVSEIHILFLFQFS